MTARANAQEQLPTRNLEAGTRKQRSRTTTAPGHGVTCDLMNMPHRAICHLASTAEDKRPRPLAHQDLCSMTTRPAPEVLKVPAGLLPAPSNLPHRFGGLVDCLDDSSLRQRVATSGRTVEKLCEILDYAL